MIRTAESVSLDRVFRDNVSTDLGPEVTVRLTTRVLRKADGWGSQGIQRSQEAKEAAMAKNKKKVSVRRAEQH